MFYCYLNIHIILQKYLKFYKFFYNFCIQYCIMCINDSAEDYGEYKVPTYTVLVLNIKLHFICNTKTIYEYLILKEKTKIVTFYLSSKVS